MAGSLYIHVININIYYIIFKGSGKRTQHLPVVEPGNSRHLLLKFIRRTLEANAATSISQCSAGAVVLRWESRVFTHGA